MKIPSLAIPLVLVAGLLAGCIDAEVPSDDADLDAATPAAADAPDPVAIHVKQPLTEGMEELTWSFAVHPGHSVGSIHIEMAQQEDAPAFIAQGHCFELTVVGESGNMRKNQCNDGGLTTQIGDGGHVLFHDTDGLMTGEWRITFSAEPAVATFLLDVDVQYAQD